MSKPFGAKVVRSTSVNIRTEDGAASVTVDQTAGVTAAADGAGKAVNLDATTNAEVIVSIAHGQFLVENTGAGSAFQIAPDGSEYVFAPAANVIVTGSQVLSNGSGNMSQTMETLSTRVTLDPAAALYAELSNTFVGGLNAASRLNIVPNAAGTNIESIIVNTGNPNPDGRTILVQNTGSGALQTITLSHQAAGGTAGGKIFCPGLVDFVIPVGGGVFLSFDSSIGSWLVRAA